MELALRPMSTSQVLDRTFHLYRNNFILFAGIAIITPALRLIGLLVQLKIFGPMVVPQSPENFTPEFMQGLLVRLVVSVGVGSILYIVGTALASSATAYAVSMVHLGKSTTIAAAYSQVTKIFSRIVGLVCTILFYTVWPVLLGYLVFLAAALTMALLIRNGNFPASSALIGLGGMLFSLAVLMGAVVWMFFALCRYALAVAACTLEHLPVRQSIRRSKFLTNGAKGKILGIILLTGLMSFVFTYVLQLPALLASNAFVMTGRTHLSVASTVWLYIADFIGSSIAGPIATIALVLVYYDQRVRKEAFDLQLMMEAVGQQQPQTSLAVSAPPTIGTGAV
jgi:glycerophosphoryl diester phosphodiesterase family protein